MKKHFEKIRKNALDLTKAVTVKSIKNLTEEDLDILAETIDMLNDIYEALYDDVFVELE